MGDARSNIVGVAACSSRPAARAGVRKFLFSSTGGALYGEPEGGRPAPESHPTDPISPYGCAKLSIEKYLHYYRVIHGFQTQIFRYANVYGPWQDGTGEAGVVAIFSEAMLANRPVKINGDGEQTRDYVFVGDLVEAAARAAERTQRRRGTSARESRPGQPALPDARATSTATRKSRCTCRAPAGEQKRSVLDSSPIRRDLGLPAWTALPRGSRRPRSSSGEGASGD